MRRFGIAFDEVTIPLARKFAGGDIACKCPALRDGNIVVWDSLAIIEYLADNEPQTAIWRDSERHAQRRAHSPPKCILVSRARGRHCR
jgi:glutathione S-transferase